MPVRVAVLDIGTNSTRALVADVAPDASIHELERHTTVTRLGEGVDATGRLTDAAIARVTSALDEYAARIAVLDCDIRTAVLTSAVRDAANGAQLVDLVRDRYADEAAVLSGDEEARLTFLGAVSGRRPDTTEPLLVIDVGGGSTELVLGTGLQVEFHVSTQLGVVRQTERHLHHDPPLPQELSALAADIRGTIAAAVPEEERRRARRAIAVAGTATSLAAIDQALDPYDPAHVHGYVVPLDTCRLLLARLASLPLQERRKVRGLHSDRAGPIVAGVVILIEALKSFDLGAFEASEHDILRGVALHSAGLDATGLNG
jgi:exopolyphosphatase/guanosine-5'-triphosphate,3'-diphosphate pyrophosphatase